MNTPSSMSRLEELEAGRALGDLNAAEFREWEELSLRYGRATGLSLELVAAAVETEFLQDDRAELPGPLADQLRKDAAAFVVPREQAADEDKVVRISVLRRFLSSAEAAWAVAAALAALLVANVLTDPAPPDSPPNIAEAPPSPEEARANLIASATDEQVTPFQGLAGYEEMTGDIVWSDEKQEGYMSLTDLPVNNPAKNQYQLWIVDPTRDDEPVDGGVFDIPAGRKTAVVRIENPLAVSKPAAFLITLEKPGGVVVSDQEVKVALAQPRA